LTISLCVIILIHFFETCIEHLFVLKYNSIVEIHSLRCKYF